MGRLISGVSCWHSLTSCGQIPSATVRLGASSLLNTVEVIRNEVFPIGGTLIQAKYLKLLQSCLPW